MVIVGRGSPVQRGVTIGRGSPVQRGNSRHPLVGTEHTVMGTKQRTRGKNFGSWRSLSRPSVELYQSWYLPFLISLVNWLVLVVWYVQLCYIAMYYTGHTGFSYTSHGICHF